MPKVSSKERERKKQNLFDSENDDDRRQRIAADLFIGDKATKRVIAPFVRIIRKGQKLHEIEEGKQFAYYLQKKPSVLIRDLSSFLSDSVDLASLLHETADVLKYMTKAASVILYMMDSSSNEIYQSTKNEVNRKFKIRWKIQENSTVATYVAFKKEYVLVEDLIEDDRFPDGVGYESDLIKSVLCIPVLTPNGECFAVIELYKLLAQNSFNLGDLKSALLVTGWMGAAIYQNSRRLALQRQQELNDYLLDLTKLYFGESVDMEKMISEIIKFAKITLNAERGSIFVMDQESSEDLVADVFDDNMDEVTGGYKKPQKVRFTKERGIAGLVARTGITANIKDVYKDARFNKEIDQKTGFITRSILCMPIIGNEEILGVIQVINKQSGGNFTTTDEVLFRTFSIYCALVLRYGSIKKQLNSMKYINNCFLKMLQLQMKSCIHDIESFTSKSEVTIPSGFESFNWYINDEEHSKMPHYCLYMLLQLTRPGELDAEKSMQYILSVRKFYRRNPYHNFEHAFNFSHCMYLILKRNKKLFTDIEIKALFLAALTHAVDHYGYTNDFLEATRNNLSYLYQSSWTENHHYYVSKFLLDNNPIFSHLSKEEYDELQKEMKHAILSTDMMTYSLNRFQLTKLLGSDSLDWENISHRLLIKGVIVMSCELSGICKPFLVSKRVVDDLYAEYYRQGDLHVEMRLCPLPNFDRTKAHLVPEAQVTFITVIVLPCLKLLMQILPNTESYYTETEYLLQTWQEIIDVRGKKCWRQDDSIVEKRSDY